MQKHTPVSKYLRLLDVQSACFRRGRKAWAKALGTKLKELRADYPELAMY